MFIFLAAIFALIEAFFTAQEVALGAVSRARLRSLQEQAEGSDSDKITPEQAKQSAQAATQVLALLERPDKLTLFFITVTSLSLWFSASLLTWAAWNESWPFWALLLSFVALLFIAEVLPLLIAAKHSEMLALRFAGFVGAAQNLFSPLTSVLGAFAYGLARVMGTGEPTPQVTESELRTALAAAEEEGVLERNERAMLEGAMDFREKTVREVMTPRPDIIGVDADSTVRQALEIALREGHSRLPIYEENIDRIIGILATKDLLGLLKNGQNSEKSLREVARKPFFVPEFNRVAATLEDLRRGRTLMAIVIDDNGGTAGLVTIEDLLEELVGEIQDEYDREEAPIVLHENPDGAREIVADADSTVRDLGRFIADELKLSASLRDVQNELAASGQTLAALALERFGDVPDEGQRIEIGEASAITADIRARFGLEMEILRKEKARIEQVKIHLKTL